MTLTRIAAVPFLGLVLATSPLSATRPLQQPTDAQRYPCRAMHAFDFWVGDFDAKAWDAPDGPVRGQLHNTHDYESCAIVEHWTSAAPNGGGGMSLGFYDVNSKAWRMVWIGDDGRSNDLQGDYRDGAMRFEGWVLDKDGNKLLARNVLQDVTPDLIRHIYSESADDGKTWMVRSDGRFVRRKKTS